MLHKWGNKVMQGERSYTFEMQKSYLVFSGMLISAIFLKCRFIAALFIIARTWKQPRFPSADEWIRKLYKYTMEYYSAVKKNTFEISSNEVDETGANYRE